VIRGSSGSSGQQGGEQQEGGGTHRWAQRVRCW
jgi:hypothetical protein